MSFVALLVHQYEECVDPGYFPGQNEAKPLGDAHGLGCSGRRLGFRRQKQRLW